MIAAPQQLDSYLASFSNFEQRAAGHDLPWLRKLRQDAFARFFEVGFPTTHDEDWRFTNVSRLAQTPFQLIRNGHELLSRAQIEKYQVAGAACQLVFVDGRWARELSSLPTDPQGIEVSGLAAQIASKPESVAAHLGSYLDIRRDAFCALNTAFAEDGAYVRVPRGVVVEAPICMLYLSTSADTPSVSFPRNLVIAEEGSQATIVEEYVSLYGVSVDGVSLSGSTTFCNTATELVAGENATISHYTIESESEQAFNISTLRIEQSRSANVASHSILLGGGLVRNNVHAVLAGEGSECLINGLFAGNGRQHLDNYMLVEHKSPHSSSRQFYNGILDGQSHGVFHGRIIVHKAAQKTDAKQTNRNLLLSDDAQIDTKPQLEIYADDVKCTHGATIGQIEQDALFYLRSRGIDEASARKLLLLAFASECLERMGNASARSHVAALIDAALFRVVHVPGASTQSGEEQPALRWNEVG
ncbi:MAG TPA: Fe-S cluster assembly protein SufD [Clostridia bacterium]|nr:Fe-S cluster assembly protein SufD [Clostridia bacterium]